MPNKIKNVNGNKSQGKMPLRTKLLVLKTELTNWSIISMVLTDAEIAIIEGEG